MPSLRVCPLNIGLWTQKTWSMLIQCFGKFKPRSTWVVEHERMFHRNGLFYCGNTIRVCIQQCKPKIKSNKPKHNDENMSWKSQLFKFEDPWNNIAPRLHMEGTKMFDMFNTWLLKDGSGQENMFQHATTQHVMDSTKLRKHLLFSLSVSLFCHPWNPVSDRHFNKQTSYPIHS